jgi:hypothetical protein
MTQSDNPAEAPSFMHFKFTDIQYETKPVFPLFVYYYDADGFHRGVEDTIENEEELTQLLHNKVARHIERGLEVRITDTGDFMVLHAQGGRIVFPAAKG